MESRRDILDLLQLIYLSNLRPKTRYYGLVSEVKGWSEQYRLLISFSKVLNTFKSSIRYLANISMLQNCVMPKVLPVGKKLPRSSSLPNNN